MQNEPETTTNGAEKDNPPVKLPYKQVLFCEEYLKDLNGTQAAIRAGYAESSAASRASKMLKNDKIRQYLDWRREQLAREEGIASPEEILRGYTKDLRFDPRKLYDENGVAIPIYKLDDDTALSLCGAEINEAIIESSDGSATILKRTIKYKYPDKKATRDSMAKHFGLFAPTKHSITDKDGNDVITWLFDEVNGATRGLPNRTQGKIRE